MSTTSNENPDISQPPSGIFSFDGTTSTTSSTTTTPPSALFSLSSTAAETAVFQMGIVTPGTTRDKHSTRRQRKKKPMPRAQKQSEDVSCDTAAVGGNAFPSTLLHSRQLKREENVQSNLFAIKREVTASMLSKLAACSDTAEMMELLTGEDFPIEITLAELAASKDWMGRTPLHHAALSCVGVEVIRLLLDVYCLAASQEDCDGNFPLHLTFIGCAASWAVLQKKVSKSKYNDMGVPVIRKPVVEALLEQMDRGINEAMSNSNNKSLLHLAVANRRYCEPGVVELVLQFNPEAVLQQDNMGKTPLHILLGQLNASSSSSTQGLSLLSHVLPKKDNSVLDPTEAASVTDFNGRTPLHVAAYCGVGVQPLEILLHVNPEVATQKDNEGYIPLQLLFIGPLSRKLGTMFSGMDKEARDSFLCSTHHSLKTLLQYVPKGFFGAPTVVETKTKQSLLHLAMALSSSCDFYGLEMMETILKSNPSLALRQDTRGRTPLHEFLSKNLKPFWKLLENEPKKINSDGEERDEEEKLRSERMEAHLQLLLGSNMMPPCKGEVMLVTAASVRDEEGNTPLHVVAAQHGFGMELLLDVFPDAARSKNCQGRLPLFLALDVELRPSRRKLHLVNLLLQAYPDAVYERDMKGRTALHILLEKTFDVTEPAFNITETLFDVIFPANIDAAKQRDSKGRTPLMEVLRMGGFPDRISTNSLRHIVSAILSTCPLSEDEDNENKTDKHTALHCAVENNLIQDIVEMVLLSYPPAAGQRNPSGQTPLSIAVTYRRGDLCSLLLTFWPLAARTLLEHGTVALHRVDSMDCLVPVIRAWPEGALHPSSTHAGGGELNFGRTPLHYWMLLESSPLDLFAALQEVERCLGALDAVKAVDARGMTPFHCLVEQRAMYMDGAQFAKFLKEKDYVRALFRAYPEAVFLRPETSGGTGVGNVEDSIIGNILKLNGEFHAFAALLEHFPKSSSVSFLSQEYATRSQPDFAHTQIPSSGAKLSGDEVDSKASKDKVERETSEQKREDENMWGIRLVHELCRHSFWCPESSRSKIGPVICMCHARFPNCLQIPLKGCLPLNTACRSSQCRLEIVQLLTTLYGAAVYGISMENSFVGLPLVDACLFDAPLDVSYHLLRSAPDTVMNFSRV